MLGKGELGEGMCMVEVLMVAVPKCVRGGAVGGIGDLGAGARGKARN